MRLHKQRRWKFLDMGESEPKLLKRTCCRPHHQDNPLVAAVLIRDLTHFCILLSFFEDFYVEGSEMQTSPCFVIEFRGSVVSSWLLLAFGNSVKFYNPLC